MKRLMAAVSAAALLTVALVPLGASSPMWAARA